MSRHRREGQPNQWIVALGAIVGLLGAASVVIASSLAWTQRDRHDRLAALDAMPDAAVATEGARAVVDGVVSAATPVQPNGLVAYLREQRRHRRDVVVETAAAPLAVALRGGEVVHVRGGYAFDRSAPGWAPVQRIDTEPTFTESAITVFGFGHGDPVLLVGAFVPGTRPREFVAETLTAGPRERWRDAAVAQIDRCRTGTVVGFVAGPLLIYAAWRLFRARPRGRTRSS